MSICEPQTPVRVNFLRPVLLVFMGRYVMLFWWWTGQQAVYLDVYARTSFNNMLKGKVGKVTALSKSKQKFVGQQGIWAANTDVTSHL